MSDAWLALDVGGANLKAAHSQGAVRSVVFELWKQPNRLAAVLGDLRESLPDAECVALTMTAELCDCYPTKRAGVVSVVNAVSEAFGERRLRIWGVDGRFHDAATMTRHPELAAAANWRALAEVVARAIAPGAGLLIDIGSTTTDVIPLIDGRVADCGLTDTERLATGALIYAGVRRTPVCALAESVPHRGRATRLAAELFATTLDVFLIRGRIPEDPDEFGTADGRPATIQAARARLARMVGADTESFTNDDAGRLARLFEECILSRVVKSASDFKERLGESGLTVVTAGSGEFLARVAAERVVGPAGRILSLEAHWGVAASVAACARALLELVREDRPEARGADSRG